MLAEIGLTTEKRTSRLFVILASEVPAGYAKPNVGGIKLSRTKVLSFRFS